MLDLKLNALEHLIHLTTEVVVAGLGRPDHTFDQGDLVATLHSLSLRREEFGLSHQLDDVGSVEALLLLHVGNKLHLGLLEFPLLEFHLHLALDLLDRRLRVGEGRDLVRSREEGLDAVYFHGAKEVEFGPHRVVARDHVRPLSDGGGLLEAHSG